MKEYKVTMTMITTFEIGVTAKSKAKAIQIAEETDLEHFTEEIDSTTYKAKLLKEPFLRRHV